MEHVLPKKTNKIKILLGEFSKRVGKLIGIDGTNGIVELDDTLDIKIQNINNI